MSIKLPNDVYSPDQIGIVIWELTGLIGKLRDSEMRTKVAPSSEGEEDHHISNFLLGVLRSTGVSAADRRALESLQIELQAIRDRAPVAHLVLPVLPNRTLKRQLVEWFRGNVHQQQLLTFSARGDIGGGFFLRIGSKQYDFTFRGQLLENRHRIAEIFDGVRQ